MKTTTPTASATPDPIPEKLVQEILDRLRTIYRTNLGKSTQGREALAGLGFTDLSLLNRYMVGFCDGQLPAILPMDKTLRQRLERIGVLNEQGEERFKGHPVFPIEGADGRRVNLWACPKDGPSLYLHMRPATLWNAIAAKHSSHLYVFTTPIEALSAAAAGCTNIAALDPDRGEPDHKAISGWGVQSLSVIVPGTPDGVRQGEQITQRLAPLPAVVVRILGCSSINELFRTKGGPALAEAIALAMHGPSVVTIPGVELLPDGLRHTIGPRIYELRGLRAGSDKLLATVGRDQNGKLHLDRVEFLTSDSRKRFVRDIARIFQEPADAIESDMMKLLRAAEWRAEQLRKSTATAPKPGTIPEADRKLGEELGRDPNLIDRILEDYDRCGLVGERANKLLAYFAMSSRKLKRPLALLIIAVSGSGKSFLQEITMLFCPIEELEPVTNLSGKALFHKEKDSLKNKLIGIDEAEGARQADYALRVLISAGVLTTEVAIKDSTNGRLTTVKNRVEGPVAVLMTATSLSMNPETVSRFFVTSVDESRGQTRAIQERQRREHTLDGLDDELVRPEILRRQRAFQRLLQPIWIINPLVDKLDFDDDSVSARRELPKRLRLLQAVAFIRQFQKPIKSHKGTPYIEVDETDLRIVKELTDELFTNNLAELSPMALTLLRQLVQMRDDACKDKSPSPDEPFAFTCRQVRDFTGRPNSSLQRHLTELCAFEFIVRVYGKRGQTCRYRLEWDGDHPGTNLPSTCPPPSHDGRAASSTGTTASNTTPAHNLALSTV